MKNISLTDKMHPGYFKSKSDTMHSTTSTHASRIETIDIVRGIALLGILLINIQTYSLFIFLRPEQVYLLNLDQPDTYGPLQFAITLFVRNEFFSIYSFLFGFGFYMMFRKNELQGLDAASLYKRRLYSLLIIGLVHGLFFWFGDILHKYALVGFSLLYFNKKPVRVILTWMAGLFFFGILIQVCKEVFFARSAAEMAIQQGQLESVFMQVFNTWQSGSFTDVLALQHKGVLLSWLTDVQNGLPFLIQIQILFLAGLVAGKINLFSNIRENKTESKLMSLVLLSIPPAIALKGLFCLNKMQVDILPGAVEPYKPLLYSLCNFTGSLLLAMVYLPLLFIMLRNNATRFFNWIGNAGKMGLTNYLLQTAVCMVLFYGYAGGLSGRVTLFQSLLLAVCIYTAQVIFSNIWLQQHAAGPMETLWKKIVYRKKIRVKGLMRKQVLTPVEKEALCNAIECF